VVRVSCIRNDRKMHLLRADSGGVPQVAFEAPGGAVLGDAAEAAAAADLGPAGLATSTRAGRRGAAAAALAAGGAVGGAAPNAEARGGEFDRRCGVGRRPPFLIIQRVAATRRQLLACAPHNINLWYKIIGIFLVSLTSSDDGKNLQQIAGTTRMQTSKQHSISSVIRPARRGRQ